jgi:CHAT domain-containing protein/tetratricopeptide (TPR) repeat protein
MKCMITAVLTICTCYGQGAAPTERAKLDELERQTVQLLAAGKLAEAMPIAQAAVDLAQKVLGPNHPLTASALNNLADLYRQEGLYAKAQPLFERALSIDEKTLGPNHPVTATMLNNLAVLYGMQGQYTKAEPLYQRALAIDEKTFGEQHLNTASDLDNLGLLYKSQGQYAKAEPLLQRALAIREKVRGLNHPDTAMSLNNLAELYRMEGQYTKAEPLYQRALTVDERILGPKHPVTATLLNNLAALYDSHGEFARAETLYQRVLAIREQALGPEHPDTAESLNNLAMSYRFQGQYAKSEPLYRRALAIDEKILGPNHPQTALALNNLADLYQTLGQYTNAKPLYERALAIREQVLGPEHPETAESLTNLADLYRFQGQYTQAESLYRRALAIDEKALGPNHSATAMAANNLGVLYQAQGQYVKAEPLFQRALVIGQQALGPDHPDIARALNNLAELYYVWGQYTQAEPLLQRALTIRERALGPEHIDTAQSLNNLAELYNSEGQYAKAEPLFKRALAIDEKTLGPDHADVTPALNNLAALYQGVGQYAKAEPLYKRALAIDEKALGSDHPGTTTARDNLAILYLDTGNRQAGERTVVGDWARRLEWMEREVRLGTEIAGRNYTEQLRMDISLLAQVQGSDKQLWKLGLQSLLVSKGRVAEETAVALNALRPRLGPEDGRNLDRLLDVWARESALLTVPARRAEDSRAALDALEDEETQLVSDLKARSSEFREVSVTPTQDDLRSKLGSAALVEMIEFDELYAPKREGKRWGPARYGAYLLAASGDVVWCDLGPAAPIDALVVRYQHAMTGPDNEAMARNAAQKLHALVFAPIRQALPHVKDFYMSPDGLLRLFPFAALIDETDKPLIETYRIQTLSTGRDLARGTPVHSVQSAWIGGLSEFGPRGDGLFFPPIPGAKDEAREVARIVRPKPRELSDDQLTKQFLMSEMNGPRILHLATHGYYSGQTGGLALRDANLGPENILNQREVAGLRLQGTQLVVLSACETALGQVSFSDGVIGLQRSLTLAGARSQILSLWPVSDAKTKDLMVSFYRNIFEKKMTKAEALRQAQLQMIHQGIEPYYWASFVLYGDGGILGE